MACPFTVVVFSHDLKEVGDVRRLAGRMIEIHGQVKLYDGRAEIILHRITQIAGGAARIPPLPRNYDVENRAHFSAGCVRPTKKPAKIKAKPNTTTTYRNDVGGWNLHSRAHTMPFRNSSSGYFVPRHSIPLFHRVRTIDLRSV